jgi:outer membrane protein assembly factor BamB
MRTILGLSALCLAAWAASPDAWPRWRGPFDTGVARGDAPLSWSDTKNIAWRTPIPGRGMSSPVIWGDRLFVTTAVPTGAASQQQAAAAEPGRDGRKGGGRGAGGGAASGQEHEFLIMAIDRATGKMVWKQTALKATPHEGYHARYGSFASNSPVTDGKRLYAFFGSRGLYAYTLDGKLVWKKEFPQMRMRLQFGEGSPTVLAGGRLLLKFDQESDSFLVALNAADGKELWRVDRDEPSSWSPPLVIVHAGVEQAIVSATNRVRSYDVSNGKLLWEAGGLGSNVIPAPVVHNGTVVVMSGHRDPNMLAIKLGGKGDLTGTESVLWTNQRGNSYTASPVLHEGKLYFVTDNGMLSCIDFATGKPHYLQQRLGDKPYNFKSSPVAANGKLYLATEQGDVLVVKLGPEYELLAVNPMGDQMFVATPAIADGEIYLRGPNELYCIRN